MKIIYHNWSKNCWAFIVTPHCSIMSIKQEADNPLSDLLQVQKAHAYNKCHRLTQKVAINLSLTFYFLMMSAYNSLQTFCRTWSGSELFDTLLVFLKEYFFKKLILKKIRRQNSMKNYPVGKELNAVMITESSNQFQFQFGQLDLNL